MCSQYSWDLSQQWEYGHLIIHMLGVLLLRSIFVSFCLICLIYFWLLNFLFYPPSISRKALSVVFIGLNLDSFLLFIVMCCWFSWSFRIQECGALKDGGFLQLPAIVAFPHLIQTFFFLVSVILILLNYDSTPRSFSSVCGHALEWSPGWSVSRVYSKKKTKTQKVYRS